VVFFIMLLAGFVPLLQVTFFALLEDFDLGRLAVKYRDKTHRIIGVILITRPCTRAFELLLLRSSGRRACRRSSTQPPRAVSRRAGQEGGCGEEGKQDLKTANMSGAIVDIPPPFRADPHALGTTLF
jgi:hypothetical protein